MEVQTVLIDKDDIRKAKECLGDQNFELIMEALGITDYDTRTKKTLCPFHAEKTPSFMYDRKLHRCMCFGCGRKVDLIDAYMMQGATYVEAVEKLFEKANVPFSFSGAEAKAVSYRFPHEEPVNEKAVITAYYAKRKISKATLDRADVREDANGNIVFNYYDTNNILYMVKYRPARQIHKGENKTWCQPGADTAPLLFNMNRTNPAFPLLICSGESDALAAIESGWTNAVSIPLGDGNLHWIEHNWDYLEQFEEIIICADNDESGSKFKEAVPCRLGTWRTKVVELPTEIQTENGIKKIKDLNEFLYWTTPADTYAVIAKAKECQIGSIIDIGDVDDFDWANADGFQFGLRPVDRELNKLYMGTLTILSGKPGAGKTSIVCQLVADALQRGKKTWLFSRELPTTLTRNWLTSVEAGPQFQDEYFNSAGEAFYKTKPDASMLIRQYMAGNVYLYRDDASNDVDALKQSMEAAVRRYGTQLVVIDNLMSVDLKTNSDGILQKQTEFVNYLTAFAVKFQVAVVLVAHPRKFANGSSLSVGIDDIAGSSNLANLCHRAISLRRITKAEREGTGKNPPNPHDVELVIIKDRIFGRSGVPIYVDFDRRSRRFYTDSEELNRRYGWVPEDEEVQNVPTRNEVSVNEVFDKNVG